MVKTVVLIALAAILVASIIAFFIAVKPRHKSSDNLFVFMSQEDSQKARRKEKRLKVIGVVSFVLAIFSIIGILFAFALLN